MAIQPKSGSQVLPMIYAYSAPQIAEYDGWTKIGYTEALTVEERIAQQGHELAIEKKLEWKGNATFDDGSGESFSDKAFHAYLRKCGVENKPHTEWFRIDGPRGRSLFNDFRMNRGLLEDLGVVPYTLRKEQAEAVQRTAAYRESHEEGEFLWNAKPRFGKTLAVYDFCKKIHARSILIVTNRPAIANSWYSDYAQFLGDSSGYKFISETEALKGKPYVLSHEEYLRTKKLGTNGFIEFVSLQDLKGSKYFGGKFEKLEYISEQNWDVLVIDEAHEGVDTLKTDTAFDHVRRKFTLHLSGTPFKALANDKFPESAIFNWTYADEQKAKRDWVGEAEENNPYANLPFLNLYTYRMSEIIKEEVSTGIEIDGENTEYAFDLNEFFETKNGSFVHGSSVDKFLDALTTRRNFPFSTPELRRELKHSFWLLDRVDSAKALAKKLKEHPEFSQYEIILAAGDGKFDDMEETAKAYDRVCEAIRKHEYTITLSVGQLTTGVTIPEWTAVLMLSNVKSPSLYMQAAFRAQNPCLFREGTRYIRKENAYVFDFDPARTLTIFEEFANDLSADTANGKGDMDLRRENVRELLNFFPVIGEDDEGEMIPLDAEKVLSIPRKLRCREVVRRGFMSNFLFQNISNIFAAPPEVMEIISKFQPLEEPKAKDIPITSKTAEELDINPETGEVEIPREKTIGMATELFGEKIYGDGEEAARKEQIREAFENAAETADPTRSAFDEMRERFKSETVNGMMEKAKERYESDLRPSDAKKMVKKLNDNFDWEAEKIYNNYKIEQQLAEADRKKEMLSRRETGKTVEEIVASFAQKEKEHKSELIENMSALEESFAGSAGIELVETIEKTKKEREKDKIEDVVRDHLRGFSRTIPSFLMAYGDESVTLARFDEVIPDRVFREVTGISLENFRFLRDGGDYTDGETGEKKHYPGNHFDPVVFDDSVKEFLRLKKKLANYFDESNTEDIFDYIPPQKTNQIFTPKAVVKKMVDMLEKENPGCFDDPEKTFIDLYMKSGLYITEIVKRLYHSEEMQIWFEDPRERLRHIFTHQVYGLAPTEIIYRIAMAYIFGFDETADISRHHFRQFDALPFAKEGTLSAELDRLFDGE